MLGLYLRQVGLKSIVIIILNRHHNLVEISYQKAPLPEKGILRFGLKHRIDIYAKNK